MIQLHWLPCDARKVRCSDSGTVTARVRTDFRPGTALVLSNEVGESQCAVIDARGRGRARWVDQHGEHTLCADPCPDLCRPVTCP